MENQPENKEHPSDANAVNSGVGAAITIVSKEDDRLSPSVYFYIFLWLEVFWVIGVFAIAFWPHGAR